MQFHTNCYNDDNTSCNGHGCAPSGVGLPVLTHSGACKQLSGNDDVVSSVPDHVCHDFL